MRGKRIYDSTITLLKITQWFRESPPTKLHWPRPAARISKTSGLSGQGDALITWIRPLACRGYRFLGLGMEGDRREEGMAKGREEGQKG